MRKELYMEKIINIDKINKAILEGMDDAAIIDLCKSIHIESCFDYVCEPPADFLEQCENTGLGAAAFAGQSSARSATHGTPSKPSVTEMSCLPKK